MLIQSKRQLTTYFSQLWELTRCIYLSPWWRLKGVWACQIWELRRHNSLLPRSQYALVDSITSQSIFMVPGESSTEEVKRHHQSLKRAGDKEEMESIDLTFSPDLLWLVNHSRDKGTSSWLNAMSLTDQGLALNKHEFRDSLSLQYNLPLVDLPSLCVCGDKFTVGHALSCKKGGFVAQRHDGVCDLLMAFINKVCNNVKIEPCLQPLNNEWLHLRGTVTSSKARLYIKVGGFWSRGVMAFFDVRVTHVNSNKRTAPEVFKERENGTQQKNVKKKNIKEKNRENTKLKR